MWRLEGPSINGDLAAYQLTRISVQDWGTSRHTVAYLYSRSCDGPAMTVTSDGWTREEPMPPKP